MSERFKHDEENPEIGVIIGGGLLVSAMACTSDKSGGGPDFDITNSPLNNSTELVPVDGYVYVGGKTRFIPQGQELASINANITVVVNNVESVCATINSYSGGLIEQIECQDGLRDVDERVRIINKIGSSDGYELVYFVTTGPSSGWYTSYQGTPLPLAPGAISGGMHGLASVDNGDGTITAYGIVSETNQIITLDTAILSNTGTAWGERITLQIGVEIPNGMYITPGSLAIIDAGTNKFFTVSMEGRDPNNNVPYEAFTLRFNLDGSFVDQIMPSHTGREGMVLRTGVTVTDDAANGSIVQIYKFGDGDTPMYRVILPEFYVEADTGVDAEADTGVDAEADTGVDAEADTGVDADLPDSSDGDTGADVITSPTCDNFVAESCSPATLQYCYDIGNKEVPGITTCSEGENGAIEIRCDLNLAACSCNELHPIYFSNKTGGENEPGAICTLSTPYTCNDGAILTEGITEMDEDLNNCTGEVNEAACTVQCETESVCVSNPKACPDISDQDVGIDTGQDSDTGIVTPDTGEDSNIEPESDTVDTSKPQPPAAKEGCAVVGVSHNETPASISETTGFAVLVTLVMAILQQARHHTKK